MFWHDVTIRSANWRGLGASILRQKVVKPFEGIPLLISSTWGPQTKHDESCRLQTLNSLRSARLPAYVPVREMPPNSLPPLSTEQQLQLLSDAMRDYAFITFAPDNRIT